MFYSTFIPNGLDELNNKDILIMSSLVGKCITMSIMKVIMSRYH